MSCSLLNKTLALVTLVWEALPQAAQGQALLLLMWQSIKRQKVNKGQYINWFIILSGLFDGELCVWDSDIVHFISKQVQ